MFPVFDDFASRKEKIAIVGMGYVGLPLAVLFGQLYTVVGFDSKTGRILELRSNFDKTGEITSNEIKNSSINFVDDPAELKKTRLIITCVPTPVDKNKLPDLQPLERATATIGKYLSPGTTVVYESTVYPGLTEEICVPILEKNSGLQCGQDFKIGYSPERINPGDSLHPLNRIVKVVSGQDDSSTKLLVAIYASVIEAGVYCTPDIRTAEAAKVIENIQRDLNIALINELSIIFNKLNIDSREVFKAAASKWNFVSYEAGLVGGHCIGVDPYYLTYKAREIGYHPDVILAGRRINAGMGKYIAEQTLRALNVSGKPLNKARILILGFTFKENIKDIRNTRVVDIYQDLEEYGAQTSIYDPLAIPEEVKQEYGIDLIGDLKNHAPYDAIILAVKHNNFSELSLAYLSTICSAKPVIIDVKGFYDRQEAENSGFYYWRL